MAKLSDALRVVNELRGQGIIEQYAVGGAMAMLFDEDTLRALLRKYGIQG